MTGHLALVVTLPLVLAGCAGAPTADPEPTKEARHVERAAVERRPLPDSPTPAARATAVPDSSSSPTALAAIEVPPTALYVCVLDVGGVRKQTAIEFAPKVRQICGKHPEMGPCQYERNACRRSGGRVYAADQKEITMETEAEYDRKVLRVRFDGG